MTRVRGPVMPRDAVAVSHRERSTPAGFTAAPASLCLIPARPGASDIDEVRELARRGELAGMAARANQTERRRLSAAVYELTWRPVFERHTRPLERGRGHRMCVIDVTRLAGDCLDRYENDLESVVDYVLRYVNKPVQNLDAWILSRLGKATVDGHRRIRGRRGAMQRPRLPQWLVGELSEDRWLCRLALLILGWVGVTATAGVDLWPVDAWVEERAEITGDWSGSTVTVVRGDIERVLDAMRAHADWYDRYVETPLGNKHAPVAAVAADAPESAALSLVNRYDVEEAHLMALAAAARDAIERRLLGGDDPDTAVTDVVERVFGAGTPGREMDAAPHQTTGYGERVGVVLADPRQRARIVALILDIIRNVNE